MIKLRFIGQSTANQKVKDEMLTKRQLQAILRNSVLSLEFRKQIHFAVEAHHKRTNQSTILVRKCRYLAGKPCQNLARQVMCV